MKISRETKKNYADCYGCGIYLIRNLDINKVYIGCARKFEDRLRQHFVDLKAGSHISSEMQDDYNAGHRFEMKIVCQCQIREYTYIKRILETFYILRYNSVECGYNQSYNKKTKENAESYIKENSWVILEKIPITFA